MTVLPTGTGWLAWFQRGRLAAWEPEGVTGDLVVDVRRLEADDSWLVLCSRELGISQGIVLRCHFGFCNDASRCDALRAAGFRVLDAKVRWRTAKRLDILLDDDTVTLSLAPLERSPELDAEAGVDAYADTVAWQTMRYRQQLLAPDLGQPDTVLRARDADVDQNVRLKPALAPLLASFGDTVDLPARKTSRARCAEPAVAAPLGAQRRVQRAESWPLPPAYRFTDVEAIGMRLDLADWGASPTDQKTLVKALVGKLNFHRKFEQGGAEYDFEFEPASSTLVLELLRYGRMDSDPSGPGQAQSQHELLLRVLVGRVDDATGQAREPAFFVPAIFVDNAWSRMIGRELQGFDKQLAAFCIASGQALRPDGRLSAQTPPLPLDDVVSVRQLPGAGAMPGAALLELADVPAVKDQEFIDVDEGVVLGGLDIAGLGWRQPDFDDAEFRRAFAREAMAGRLSGFRSVQVSPVDGRQLSPTWIGGRFEFQRLRVALPSGQPRLRLLAAQGAPDAWNALAILAGNRTVALPAGDWYRLRFDMALKVDDGLAW